MQRAMKRLIGTFAGVAVLLLLLIDPANAITITDATLSAGNVTVSGNKAQKSATITWEATPVATATKGGAFTFTTAVVPADCVGTLSDGSNTIDVAISGCTPPPATAFPATGQETCWNSVGTVIGCAGTGYDGDIRAGAALSYTDNGDGTITDDNTGLKWEKKDDNNAGGIHDKDTTYTWDNAFAVHIARLNNRCANDEAMDCTTNGDADCAGVGGACGFAGHRDWRLPNVKELQSIVNLENSFPAVSPEFNTGCVASCAVLTCSCTAGSRYWSSSSNTVSHTGAWFVDFNGGTVADIDKIFPFLVRAVRGGL